jgi:PadR family transcriptional regulator PadR
VPAHHHRLAASVVPPASLDPARREQRDSESAALPSPVDRLLVYWRSMPRADRKERGDLLQGTLDMLILRSVLMAPAHGHTIAHVIEKSSDEVLQVEHGSLYPALHRLEDQGLIASFWGTSENNRKARYYRITPAGRKHLTSERSRWEQLAGAVARVLGPATE